MSEMRMSSAEEHKFKESLEQYMEKNKIGHLFSQMMKQLLVNKPNDPLSFLEKFLTEHHDCYLKSFRRIFIIGQPLSLFNQLSLEFYSRKFCDCIVIDLDQLILQENAGSVIGTDIHPGRIVLSGKELCTLLQMFIDKSSQKDEIRKYGYILTGFPQNREQALALQVLGIYPDHVFALEFNDKSEYDRRLKAVDYDVNVQAMYNYYLKNRDGLLGSFQREIVSISDAGLPGLKILSLWDETLRNIRRGMLIAIPQSQFANSRFSAKVRSHWCTWNWKNYNL